MWPDKRYPINLNDPCWAEDYSAERNKLFKQQRIERGFADPDWWEMCDYLCVFLPKLFRALAEHGHGAPADMSPAEWKSALLSMSRHFSDAYDLKGIDLTPDMISSVIQQADEKKELQGVLKTIRPELLEAYQNGGQENLSSLNDLMNDASDRELAEGFRLFQEYFWCLWD